MLQVVYSDHDLLDEASNTGVAGNAPEARKRLVQAALRAGPGPNFLKVSKPEPNLFDLGGLVHSPGMLEFLSTCWDRWQQEWTLAGESKNHLIGVFCSPQADASSTVAPPFNAGFFAARHELSSDMGRSVFSQACYFAMDKETPISATTCEGLLWDLAVIRESVQQLAQYRVVYAQITHPGHHAFASSYGGFCFINQAAVGIKLMQQQHKYRRIAVVDVDFHAGNGTSAILANEHDVFFASLHADPNLDYPYNFFPQSSPHQLHINLPKHGCTWSQYSVLLSKVIDAVIRFQPDALVVSLGVDTLRGDPVALPQTRCGLAPQDYSEMGKMLLGDPRLAKLPTLVVQEGGYKLDEVHLAVSAFLSAAGQVSSWPKL
ncbi:hypothetical protein BASA81_009841 [Batrachochytrium salamandrivorans]|nr:hypothetical protein BASA81_009841 [Batrachochytrium salamandrivorans]